MTSFLVARAGDWHVRHMWARLLMVRGGPAGVKPVSAPPDGTRRTAGVKPVAAPPDDVRRDVADAALHEKSQHPKSIYI